MLNYAQPGGRASGAPSSPPRRRTVAAFAVGELGVGRQTGCGAEGGEGRRWRGSSGRPVCELCGGVGPLRPRSLGLCRPGRLGGARAGAPLNAGVLRANSELPPRGPLDRRTVREEPRRLDDGARLGRVDVGDPRLRVAPVVQPVADPGLLEGREDGVLVAGRLLVGLEDVEDKLRDELSSFGGSSRPSFAASISSASASSTSLMRTLYVPPSRMVLFVAPNTPRSMDCVRWEVWGTRRQVSTPFRLISSLNAGVVWQVRWSMMSTAFMLAPGT